MDFLILFIGITTAFYVENFRKDLEDSDDLKIYIDGLLDDLKEDSTRFVNERLSLDKSIKAIDTLLATGHDLKVSHKLSLVANGLLLHHDIGLDNDASYRTLVNSGQLRLMKNRVYLKNLKDYYRQLDVGLRSFETEFKEFRANSILKYLENKLYYDECYWDYSKGNWRISDNPRTNPLIFETIEFRNYLIHSRQYLIEFRNSLRGIGLINDDLKKQTDLLLRDQL